MSKFKIGERVIATKAVAGNTDCIGKASTVIIHGSHFDLGVQFDERILEGHNCEGKGKSGYCRFGHDDEFELIESDWDE